MTEIEFIESIDCRFPYSDEAKCRRLCEEGSRICPNAAFMVLYELCRLPRSASVEPPVLKRIVAYWKECFSHPLVPMLTGIAARMIEGETVSVSEAMNAMRAVADYPGQRNALGIAYFSCDDVDGEADRLYEDIIARWQRLGETLS